MTAIGPISLEYLDPEDDPRKVSHFDVTRGNRSDWPTMIITSIETFPLRILFSQVQSHMTYAVNPGRPS